MGSRLTAKKTATQTSLGSRLLAALALIALSGACTTFYGLKPDATTSSGTTGSGGGGGSGGSPNEGFLPKLDAAHLCALVASCPTLGASIVASTGVPVVQTGAATDVRNFSACVDWLTLPLSSPAQATMVPRVGFDLARSMIVCMAASTSCDDAIRCSFAEVLAPGDPRCASAQNGCDASGNFVDCSLAQSFACKSDLFAPDSSCGTAQTTSSCATGLCAAAEFQCGGGGYFFSCDAAMHLKQSINCNVYGLSCDDSAADPAGRGCFGLTGLANCAATDFGQETCVGSMSRVHVCTGTVNADIDCSAVGEACAADSGPTGPARCKRSDAACSPYDATTNVCSGTTISACLDGLKDTIDCAAIGLSCVPGTGGSTAHCG